jgi:N-acetylmuramoyl-L-alanine amidase
VATPLIVARLPAVLLCAGTLAFTASARAQSPVVVAHTADETAAAPLPGVMNRATIVIDAAHGGGDSGAHIGSAGSSSLQEKNITLALALKLQSLLSARGLTVVMTRTTDAADRPGNSGVPMSLDDRAGIANRPRAAACLLLHAAGSGNGVHLYASELDGVALEAPVLPWTTAQAAWVASSAQLEKQLAESLRQSGIPRILSRASIRPVDSLTCPAVVIELAPESENLSSLNSGDYQQRVAQSLASALEAWSKQAQPPQRQLPVPRPHALVATPKPGAQP